MLPLDDLYAQSDYITLHVGLTPQTQGMINADSIRKMKKGVRLVNCARGELLNEPDVVEALQSGQLGGAGLDVYSNEPLKDSPLMTLPNVLLTPHIAGSTNEAHDPGMDLPRRPRRPPGRWRLRSAQYGAGSLFTRGRPRFLELERGE